MKQAYAPDPAHNNERNQPTLGEQATPVTDTAKDVAHTVKEHARDVGGEVMDHGRHLAGQVGQRLSGEARSQNDRLASGMRKLADDLDQMSNGNGSAATTLIQQLSGTSRQAASYLEQHGPEGLLREAQEFARRKPGAFLVGAAIAGFVAGRLGKGLMSSAPTTRTDSTTSTDTTRPTGVAFTPTDETRPTGVAFTPTGETRPTATGVAQVPVDPSAAAPIGSAPRSGARP